MAQGRGALHDLLDGRVSWPPVVVPFGLDPFGWHGARKSYRNICAFALAHCTLLPKVLPVSSPLFIGGKVEISSSETCGPDGTVVRRVSMRIGGSERFMEEILTPGDSSWKIKKRWIETDNDLDFFIRRSDLEPAEPDLDAVRKKERDVGAHGLPYVEVNDPFYTVCEMFPTDQFFIRTITNTDGILRLVDMTAERVLHTIERLCHDTGCPFVLRLIGAEMAAPPFMSRENFLRFEGNFYQSAADIARSAGIPVSFHCHGPVGDIIDDVWEMGYSFMEPFEPPPRGNVTIGEALAITRGRGVVFGGVDEVLFTMGTPDDIRRAEDARLDDARGTGFPFILSQSATPFYEPLTPGAKDNILLFMERAVAG